jgi:hypothetical protein
MIDLLGRPRSRSVYVRAMVVVMSLSPLRVTRRLRINVARLLDQRLSDFRSKSTSSTHSLPRRMISDGYGTLLMLLITGTVPLLVLMNSRIETGIGGPGGVVIHGPIDRGRGMISPIVGTMRYSLIDIGSVKGRLGYVTGEISNRYLAARQTHELLRKPLLSPRRRLSRASTMARIISVGFVGVRRHAGGLEDSRNLVEGRDSPSAGTYSPTQA